MTETLTESMRRYADIINEGAVTDELVKLFSTVGEANPQQRAQQVAQRLQQTIGRHDSGHSSAPDADITPEFLQRVIRDLEGMIQRRSEAYPQYRKIDGEDVGEAIANVLYADQRYDPSEDEYEAQEDAYTAQIVPAFGFEHEPRWDGKEPERDREADAEADWLSYKEDEYTKDR